MNQLLRFLPFALFILLSVLFWRGLALDPQHLPSQQINQLIPSFRLPALEEQAEPLRSKALRGQVSLLTIWASWCDSCQTEQAFLLQLAATYPIAMFGINYKDDAESARAWLKQFGNPFRQIGQDSKGRLAIELGVYGVPETFLIDAAGRIRYRHTGALTVDAWQHDFLPRIQALGAT